MGESRSAIDWDAARAANRDNWDDRVPLHEMAYAIADLDDPDHLSSVARADLGAWASTRGGWRPTSSMPGRP
ncbi:hypothetical protein [Arthrobacter sp. TMS1-12-1]